MRLYWAIFLLCCCAPAGLRAQPLDRVLAVVGDEVVLASELRAQLSYAEGAGAGGAELKCQILESLVTNKLLLARAEQDSVTVSEDRVNDELDRRIRAMTQRVGSEKELEKLYGKPVEEMRVDLRPDIQEQLIVDQQKNKILSEAKVTPRDVKVFYNQLPEDSLPYLPAEVEISHIMLKPEASAAGKEKAKQKLETIRRQIVSGEVEFADAARTHSHDYGSAKQDGCLGEFTRGAMVAEFEEEAYNLRAGEVSRVFESPFGFHIILLKNRTGDVIDACHILIRPEITPADEARAMKRLAEIRQLIMDDSLSFAEAAREYSDDRATKDNGGRITSPQGDLNVPLDKLDADLYLKIDQMKPGEISEPAEMIAQQGGLSKAYHIIYLRNRRPPHRASLESDYRKFQQAALEARKAEKLDEWLESARKRVYIEIKENDCSQALQNWN